MTFNNPIVGGEGGELIRESIKSPDFVPGVSGWIIRRDGSAEFNNVNIRVDLSAGTIVVGPDDAPQVIIGSDANAGFIKFPTNAASEVDPANIFAEIVNEGLPNERVRLNMNGGVTGVPGQLFFGLLSSANDGSAGPLLSLTAGDGGATVSSDGMVIDGELEVIGNLSSSSNFPSRVVRGKTVTSATTTLTTLGTTDTEVTDAECTSTSLENGVAYEVTVKVYVQKTTGVAAAGTHSIDWKLWDGAVGGTQLGSLIRKAVTTATNNLRDSQSFTFCFEYAGASGSKTLRLSGDRSTGADTLQAVVNDNYLMLVKRIGNASKITNL